MLRCSLVVRLVVVQDLANLRPLGHLLRPSSIARRDSTNESAGLVDAGEDQRPRRDLRGSEYSELNHQKSGNKGSFRQETARADSFQGSE